MDSFDHEFNEKHFRVAIFGSARIRANDPRYNQIYNLARMIAAEGIDIVTGGGPGIMEAANRGHQAGHSRAKTPNGSHSIGLTIQIPEAQGENHHLDIKKDFERFSGRLDYFMKLSNVVVVAPGGVGTLLEFLYTWQLVQVRHICNTPIILLGRMWPDLMTWIRDYPLKQKLISPDDIHPIFLANHCKKAMKIIKRTHEHFQKAGPDECINFKKYKIDEVYDKEGV